ncbi:MAG: tetraacyldisaccharide 4'-kinase [Deltaproteobacteria bacterium]|nr:tetraacyldisaccharide 4'-kinase [Deltaproteobacteria bacterium]MBW2009297.1 tetraacyldisaccharide 4'-kinase [Deltaproteobacteria bacterium]
MTLRGVRERDWYDEKPSQGRAFSSGFLDLLSFLYGIGVRAAFTARRKGLLKTKNLPGFVLSVGNLTVGGTGKTPAAVMIARWARDRGHRVAVLSRGYGGATRQRTLVVSDGTRVLAGPDQAGDEPCLLARRLEEVPVVVGRKRYDAGVKARKIFGSDFFVLDDGFQHHGLARDLNLLLLDATLPFGNGRLLPAGPLREPTSAVSRAHALILTRAEEGERAFKNAARLRREWAPRPVFLGRHVARRVVLPGGEKHAVPGILKGMRVAAFAGIGRPASFMRTLDACGAQTVLFESFRDHHEFRAREIRALLDRARALGAELVLTTEKDWIRLFHLSWARERIGYLRIRFEMSKEDDGFFEWLEAIVPPPGKAGR